MGRGGERWTLGATRGDHATRSKSRDAARVGPGIGRRDRLPSFARSDHARVGPGGVGSPTLTRQFGRKNQRCQAALRRAGGGIGVRSRRRCRRGGAGISRKLTSRRVRLDRAGPPGTQCARGSLALERATIPTSGKRPVASDLTGLIQNRVCGRSQSQN
jgi:hypothetical protein